MTLRALFAAGALTLATAAAFVAPASAKEWKSVTIATEGAYAPWNLTNPDGTLGGFEVELTKNLCERLKIECKFITSDWDGMIPALKAGKFDMMMDAVSITPEREEVIAFTSPYAATPASFAVAKDSGLTLPGTGTTVKLTGDAAHDKATVDALRTALKGKTIGIQTATIYTKFVYDNFKDIATIREYKTAPEHDLDLAAGRIDAAFDDDTYFAAAFSKPENANLMIAGPEIGGTIWGKGEGFGLRKEDTELKALFDKAIAEAIADGTVKTLSEKWFKIDVTP
ncbi:transporter substrate-binding domain-containing protein [Segnochrobactrum spirostomi]|uniref:Transporter substrate-binding domain-containing protein n=1 Tax=Segnochrobactrum spirostomi TaxID=2608987 RepID=A0A6A7Y605_9HYPH|nr:transporter substrate-binding domain-containing protein [Segnochrobactrum spirostomi]MQT13029.1 transporter substrate-binding domain-containing protein [Segnochrobactrum spirostomi]